MKCRLLYNRSPRWTVHLHVSSAANVCGFQDRHHVDGRRLGFNAQCSEAFPDRHTYPGNPRVLYSIVSTLLCALLSAQGEYQSRPWYLSDDNKIIESVAHRLLRTPQVEPHQVTKASSSSMRSGHSLP